MQSVGLIQFPRLPLADDGTVTGGAEKLCSVLDAAGIIDLTAPKLMPSPPAGLAALALRSASIGRWPQLGMPVRGAVPPRPEAQVVTAEM